MDRIARVNPQVEGLIARLEIEVNDTGSIAVELGETRRKVGGDKGCSATTLAGIDGNHPSLVWPVGGTLVDQLFEDLLNLGLRKWLAQKFGGSAAEGLQNHLG